jgi:hypothetical protein
MPVISIHKIYISGRKTTLMIYKVQILERSKSRPEDLFAMTEFNSYILIRRPAERKTPRPRDGTSKDLFDKVSYFVDLGCQPDAYVEKSGKQMRRCRLGASLESIAFDQHDPRAGELVKKTDFSKTGDTDIYGAINFAKEAQYTLFGKIRDDDYSAAGLISSDAKRYIEDDPIAAGILSLVLRSDGPIHIHGNAYGGECRLRADDYKIRHTLSTLASAGILAIDKTRPGSLERALESEIAYPDEFHSMFVKNSILRRVLKNILKNPDSMNQENKNDYEICSELSAF